MKKQRKQYAPEEKVAILRRHLLEKEPISKVVRCSILAEEDPDEGRGSGRAHSGTRRAKKRDWGTLAGVWVPHDSGARSWIWSGADRR